MNPTDPEREMTPVSEAPVAAADPSPGAATLVAHPAAPKVGPAPGVDAGFALRFLSGPRAGTEMPLKGRGELVFGRGKEADLVLAEDLVSRRHAVLSLDGPAPTISDLGSTNGTFVNGERVSGKAPLRSGDRLLIGSSIARLVVMDDEPTTVGAVEPSLVDRDKRPAQGSTMAGRLEEVPLVDLLQLFSNSRKSGTLVARGADGTDGEVRLLTGQIAAARVEGKPELTHRKALARLLRLMSGAFEFVPVAAHEPVPHIPTELQEPTELLLMDALRLTDELVVLEPELPVAHAVLAVPKPLPGRLRALEPAALDLFQLALEQGTFGGVVDHSPQDDVEAVRGLLRLVSLGFLEVQA